MNIQQWLEKTAHHAPPDQEVDLGLSAHVKPHTKPEQHGRKYRRRKKHQSTDSSIIEPPRQKSARHQAASHARSPDGARAAVQTAAKSCSSRSSQSSAPQEVFLNTYEKRARHKTRPDLYEPKTKDRRKKESKKRKACDERQEREDRQIEPKRRKSHRSGDGGRTAGLVQGFQLKNGPKNNRLTLKPQATTGLFKHGRTSAQVVGRGGGLPDLAFNEMRFLQRPKDHQDELPDEYDARLNTKLDSKKQPRDEISAYFAAQQNYEDQVPPAARIARVPTQDSRTQVQVQEKRVTDLPVDLPDKPFLGFGSRGMQQESKDTQLKSNSHYTWSESVAPQAKETPIQTTRATIERPPLPRSPKRHAGDKLSTVRTVRRRDIPGHDTVPDDSNWLQSRRTRGPALVEVYVPPAIPTSDDHRNRRSVTKTTLQSLPRQPPSEPPKAKSACAMDRQQLPISYHTSDILDVHDQVRFMAGQNPYSSHRLDSPVAHEQENRDTNSYTPTGKLLRCAYDAIEQAGAFTNHVAPALLHADNYAAPFPKKYLLSNEKPDAPTLRIPRTPRQTDLGVSGLRERRLESAAGMDRKQNPEPSHPVQVHWRPERPVQQDRYHHNLRSVTNEDDEMLDNQPDLATFGIEDMPVYATAHQAEKLVHNTMSDQPGRMYEEHAQVHGRDVWSDASQLRISASNQSAEYLHVTTPLHRGTSIQGDIRSGRSPNNADSFGVGMLDELAGFWKPHVLY